MAASLSCFNDSDCSHPPPDVLMHYVEIYKARLHLQPLPLFNIETLSTQVLRFPPYLLHSFLAVTMPFSEHSFFGNAKEKAIDSYVRSARETVIHAATEGESSVELLQSLCLLSLNDLAAGRRSRMWMNIGVASRLVSSPQSHQRSPVAITATTEDKTRCFWSVFVLERAFTPGPNLLQSDTFPLVNSTYPPSPPRPASVADLGSSSAPGFPASSATSDLGVSTYCLQLTSIWGEVVAYSRRLRSEQVEDPWLASSTYHVLVAKYCQFEASLAQIHRFRNVGFQSLSTNELSENKYYWMAWLQLQISFHGGHALLHHPVFYITNSRKFNTNYPPPSFLQKAVDQALLHSGWIVRLFRTWEFLGFELNDPFLGHFIVVSATIHWIFQFANDTTVADRARSDFGECQRLLLNLSSRWPQFSLVVNGLEFLQSLARQFHETTGNQGIPSFKQSLLWDLLDSDIPSTGFDAASYSVTPSGQRIETQHLAPLHEPSSVPDREYPNDMIGSAGYQTLQSPIFFPSSTLNNDLFSDIDLSIFSRLKAQSNFNLHGVL
ncbi:hypothetical protein P170DRAFT_507782 [Aspergillus steynii IBT 23096]|uniref:Xylanolytic transcriptional activator regulatory domain-containing protein n=1 Tax=Aspergillus steynii IBT 23096 TaxID=1392250 RepID=A0A2I2GJM7_9EURO|nr:uncharacterized protein P170DRAFT_507782 [Aspergillus steynii IBT 23096]PLB53074.1 hypothetical protein P170DRAFT_507782 [Aspergillus steynii IBT 23096]